MQSWQLSFFFKIGGFIHAILFPPKIAPPNEAYGKISPIVFPASTVKGDFTYTINTPNGSLPQDFPDRLIVYPMVINQPNLLNLDNTKTIVSNLGFVDSQGNTLPEISRGGSVYEWDEPTGFQKKLVYDIVSQNFTITSNYLTQLSVLEAQNLGDQNNAFTTVQNFMQAANATPSDLDITLTQNPPSNENYTTSPILYSIANGQLTPSTSLSNTQVIRVDFYQKAISYSITAGTGDNLTQFQNFDEQLPIMYPHPPLSTMDFLVASGQSETDVVQATFYHQNINLQPDQQALYPIKTAQQAYDELKSGKAYIAAYNGSDSQILISNVFLAYYLGQTQQQYLMPVIVFEGQNGFFAYVSAIPDTSLQ